MRVTQYCVMMGVACVAGRKGNKSFVLGTDEQKSGRFNYMALGNVRSWKMEGYPVGELRRTEVNY